jgi:hypothetical protein
MSALTLIATISVAAHVGAIAGAAAADHRDERVVAADLRRRSLGRKALRAAKVRPMQATRPP